MESGIYSGTLRHRRFSPVRHEFTYPLFMVFLDIDRLPELMKVSPLAGYNRRNWISYEERDHFGDPARSSARARIAGCGQKRCCASRRSNFPAHASPLPGVQLQSRFFLLLLRPRRQIADGHGRSQQYFRRDRKLLAHAKCRAPGGRKQAVPIPEDNFTSRPS